MRYNTLSKEEKAVIEGKATEPPFWGEYDDFYNEGIYLCRRCNNPLFKSSAKFKSGTGWPSFDDSINKSIVEQLDDDGIRIEMLCSNCKAHLGHVFRGEKITPKNTRFCANSLSLQFIPKNEKLPEIITP